MYVAIEAIPIKIDSKINGFTGKMLKKFGKIAIKNTNINVAV